LRQTLYYDVTENRGYGNQNGSYVNQMASALRDIFGNPFQKVELPDECHQCHGTGWRTNPAGEDAWGGINVRCCSKKSPLLTWNDGLIPTMAKTIYDAARWSDLPILADALEEAGCTDPLILRHCRAMPDDPIGCPLCQ